ncbi:hypothetical protein ACHWQZ_G003071 [Mnemiopsis leidyi]
MFDDKSSIDLTGWHFRSDIVVTLPSVRRRRRRKSKFIVGFLFSFKEDWDSLKCTNGHLKDLTLDRSLFYCLCDMGYGGQDCDVLLKKSPDSEATLSSSVLDLIKNYKVPGMFDLQDEIKKGTVKILRGMGNNKHEIFSQIKKTGHDVEKSKNAILAAQSLMLDELRTESDKVLRGLSGLQAAMGVAFESERNDRIYRTNEGQKVVVKAISDSNKVVADNIKRLTGKVVENRCFKQLKLYVPVYQEQFQKAIGYGDYAEQEFSDYLNCHKLPLQAAKEAAKKASVETSDSLLMAQMQINMVDGCTEVYTDKINATWAQLMEVHLALTTMELWHIEFKIKMSSDPFEKDYLSYEKHELEKKTISDTVEFKEVLRTRSCHEFSLPELLGGGCGPSITFPGQTVPMKCEDPNNTLILLSNGKPIKEVLCKADSMWAVNTTDLRCVTKCLHENKYYDIGDKIRLPDAPNGFYYADEKGTEVAEITCLTPQLSISTLEGTKYMEDLRGSWSIAKKTDINECTVHDFCKFGGHCKNNEGGFSCTCLAGYTVGLSGKCEDINECEHLGVGYNKCLVQDQLGTCQDRDGSYGCTCLAGSYTTQDHGGQECVACNCNPSGVTSKVCDENTGVCLCSLNVGGSDCGHCLTGYTNYPYCTECAAGYYDYPNCKKCSCTDSGVTAQQCNPYTGSCECKANVVGSQCSQCAHHYTSFPSCVPVVRHGTLSNWGPWSSWVNQGSCGEWNKDGYQQMRTRTRTCHDSTKTIHGTSCAGHSLTGVETRFQYFCKHVTGVFILLPDKYWAPATGNLWMGIRQGGIECTTSNPTWRSPSDENKIYVEYGDNGCRKSFDWTKPIEIHLYSDSSNDVYISRMGALIGGHEKAWYSRSGEGYAVIDKSTNVGWQPTTS